MKTSRWYLMEHFVYDIIKSYVLKQPLISFDHLQAYNQMFDPLLKDQVVILCEFISLTPICKGYS